MLQLNNYLIREKISFLKLSDQFDIFDPSSGIQVGSARETIHVGLKLLRLLINKMILPTKVEIVDTNGVLQFSIKKGFQFLVSKVSVLDAKGIEIGFFKSRIFSLGGGFHVFDRSNLKVAEVKGDWKGWNFKFIGNNGYSIGAVTKQWAGIGKELFTSADNYMITINGTNANPGKSTLLLAAGLAIDIVYKENK